MELMEKVSYLKGLVDMAEFDPSSKETKVLNAMLEVLDEMAKTVQSLTEANAQMCDVIESIDEDLSQVEEDLYGDEDEDEEDEDGDFDIEDDDEDDDGDLYEVTLLRRGLRRRRVHARRGGNQLPLLRRTAGV